MSLPRIIIIFTIVLFGSIGIAALVNKRKPRQLKQMRWSWEQRYAK